MADTDWPAPDAVAAAPPALAAPDDAGLRALVGEAPWGWSLFQVLRLLEARHANRPRLGRSTRPSQDAIRLAQEPSVEFAPATLTRYEPATDDRPPLLLQAFFGLFGPDGPLPLHLTEYARDRRRNFRDATFQRFADLFHHRALSLFYRAWADARPTVSFDRPADDRFATYAGALAGYGQNSLRERDAMPDLTKLHFAGLFANQTRHAEGLAAILSAFFAMPVRVECFVGSWLPLAPPDRTRLGERTETGALGRTVLVGARVWSRQHKFRIVVGPVGLADYQRLLPGGLSLKRLIAIVRNYAGDTMAWDVNVLLRAGEVPALRLGAQGRIGWTTWLMPRRTERDADELFLDASADSLAQRIDRATPADGAVP